MKLKATISFTYATLIVMRQREEEPRARLWRRAARQRGYFTAAQALEDGYSYQSQYFHVRRGNWTRIARGLYRFREFTDLPSSDLDHLVRWTLWSLDRAVISHATALGVHRLGVMNPSTVHLTVPPGFRQRDEAVVIHRDDLPPEEIEHHEGFRVTSPVRAIIESAADGVCQSTIDSAISALVTRQPAARYQLLTTARAIEARVELSIERALKKTDL